MNVRYVFMYTAGCYSWQILMKFKLSLQILVKSWNIKFHENQPVGRWVRCGPEAGRQRYRLMTMWAGGRQAEVQTDDEINPQKATLGIRTSKATWGQIWPHHENGYN